MSGGEAARTYRLREPLPNLATHAMEHPIRFLGRAPPQLAAQMSFLSFLHLPVPA